MKPDEKINLSFPFLFFLFPSANNKEKQIAKKFKVRVQATGHKMNDDDRWVKCFHGAYFHFKHLHHHV